MTALDASHSMVMQQIVTFNHDVDDIRDKRINHGYPIHCGPMEVFDGGRLLFRGRATSGGAALNLRGQCWQYHPSGRVFREFDVLGEGVVGDYLEKNDMGEIIVHYQQPTIQRSVLATDAMLGLSWPRFMAVPASNHPLYQLYMLCVDGIPDFNDFTWIIQDGQRTGQNKSVGAMREQWYRHRRMGKFKYYTRSTYGLTLHLSGFIDGTTGIFTGSFYHQTCPESVFTVRIDDGTINKHDCLTLDMYLSTASLNPSTPATPAVT